MSSLPEEIHLEILVRVPARSIPACKRVCKTWCKLISNPNFVKLHLDHTIQTNKRSMVFKSPDKPFRFCSVSYDSLSMNGLDAADVDDVVELSRIPIRHDDMLLCSCNGLLLVWSFDSSTYYLYNPVTDEYKDIPRSPNPGRFYIYAFGYDCKTGDYKLVNIESELVYYDGEESEEYSEEEETDNESCTVEIYTLRTNSWKTLEPIAYRFKCDIEGGVLVNGAFHWCGVKQGQDVIISLDIGDERFEHLQIPDTVVEEDRQENYYMNVGVLERWLSLFVSVTGKCELWVMQDYGVCESWTKRHVINHENVSWPVWEYVTIMWCFENGEILLKISGCGEETGDLVIYDPKQGSARKTKVRGLEVTDAENSLESLVSLRSRRSKKRKKKLRSRNLRNLSLGTYA